MASRRSRARGRRRTRAWWPTVRLPELEQRHWDLIGLGLVAFAAFFACVFYLGWAGGRVGEAMADGLLFLFGGLGSTAPIVLFAVGAFLVVRPVMPSTHPLKAGAVCLGAALTLGLAAGSFGLGPGDTARDGFLDPDYLEHHGGLVGESLFWLSGKLFSEAGSHILFVFLLLAGVMLLTGASIAGILTATHEAAVTTTERVRRTPNPFLPPLTPLPVDSDPVRPPEADHHEPVVRATHVEAPALDGSERYPDLYDEPTEAAEPDEPEQEPRRGPRTEEAPEQEREQPELTPMGNRRSPVTE